MINSIRNIYYSVWSDAISYERIKNGGDSHWKIFTFVYMSILLSLNILTLLSAILFITGYDVTFKLDEQLGNIFSSELLAKFLWALILLFIPSIIITYFSVFFNKKYEYILENYKFKKGRLLLIYFFLTVIGLFGFSLLNKFF